MLGATASGLVCGQAEPGSMLILAAACLILAAACALFWSALFFSFFIFCILVGEEEPDDPLHADRLAKIHADRLAKIQMFNELQENPGIKFVGALRLPDSGNKNNKNVDLVILTRRKLFLVEVNSWLQKVKYESGSWCQKCKDGSWRRHENIVEEGQKRATLLELYFLRRGLKLPTSCVQFVVVFTNPNCSLDESIRSIPGVFSCRKWEAFLRKKTRKCVLSWMIPKNKGPLSDGVFQQLLDILQTAPMWDRLRLNDGHTVLGDFLHFNGSAEDMGRLKMVKRSRISSTNITREQKPKYMPELMMATLFLETSCISIDFQKIWEG